MHARRCLATLLLIGLLGGTTPAADLATVVPDDAFLFAEVIDPQGIWDDFDKSAARDVIRSLPQGELQFRMALGIFQQVALQQFGVLWGDFVAKYGKRFALVLPDVPVGDRVEPCLLLDAGATKADLKTLLRQRVEPAILGAKPDAAAQDVTVQGVPLRVLHVAGVPVAYGFVRDVCVLGHEAGVRKLLAGQVRRPLAASTAFAKARARLAPKRGLQTFINVQRLLDEVRGQLEANPQLARSLDDVGLSGVQFAIATTAFDGRGVRDRIYLHTGARKMGLVRLLSSVTAGSTVAAEVLPKACPIVLAMTFKDGTELWSAILAFLEGGGEVERMARLDADRDALRLRFGIDFDHGFIGTLGGEAFLAANPDAATAYAAKRQWPGRNDIPFIIGFRVADREGLQTTIHRLISSQPIVGQGVERIVARHRDVEVSSLRLPGSTLRPAYAFVGDYLLIARSQAILQQCIDAKATGEGLASVGRYRTFGTRMPAKHTAMAYIDLQTLATALVGDKAGEVPTLLTEQLRGFYATLHTDEHGVTLGAYSRFGLPGLLGIAGGLAFRTMAAPPPLVAEPAQADF